MKRKLSLVALMMLLISISSVALSSTSTVRRSIKDSVSSSREDTTTLSEDENPAQFKPNVTTTEFLVSDVNTVALAATNNVLRQAVKQDVGDEDLNEEIEKVVEETITVTKVDEIYYAAGNLNVREDPSIKSDIITTLSPNDEVHVIGELEDDNYTDWVQIEIDGEPAYVAAKYLSKEQLEQEYVKGTWDGITLDANLGKIYGPNGYETYYNLNMKNIVKELDRMGIEGSYWVRDDGVKMYGEYVMIAADLSKYPKGTLLETSVGIGIVCDTGEFVTNGSGVSIDVAVTW